MAHKPCPTMNSCCYPPQFIQLPFQAVLPSKSFSGAQGLCNSNPYVPASQACIPWQKAISIKQLISVQPADLGVKEIFR
jgi:hypothetical protein